MLQINDEIYGDIAIEEPILIELLSSPAVLRLKHITQAGVPQIYNSIQTYDRYEHSVGVMLLLKKLGMSLEEQIAGLLHDVSHLAFSHVSEWVFQENGSLDEGFNQTLTREFIEKSELKPLLERYDYDVNRIINFDNFSVLKSEIPDINADRGDYSLREISKWIDKALPQSIIDDLVIIEGKIVNKTINIASKYAYNFLDLQLNYWGSFDSILRYYLFSNLLRKLVNQKVINLYDFYGTEEEIIHSVEQQEDSEVMQIVSILKEKDLSKYKDKFGKTIKKKCRYIDPLVEHNNTLYRLSTLDETFKNKLDRALLENKNGITI